MSSKGSWVGWFPLDCALSSHVSGYCHGCAYCLANNEIVKLSERLDDVLDELDQANAEIERLSDERADWEQVANQHASERYRLDDECRRLRALADRLQRVVDPTLPDGAAMHHHGCTPKVVRRSQREQ